MHIETSFSLFLSLQVVRMALQVLAILSASKDGLEIDTQLSEASRAAEQTQKKPSSSSGPTSESKSKVASDTKSRSPVVPKSKAPTVEAKSKPQLNKYFRLFLLELLKIFDSNRSLMEKKGSFIIR